MKKYILPFLLVVAPIAGVIAAFGTVAEAPDPADNTTDIVFLGELDLAERAEIWRNQYRRMTPGGEQLVQDVGAWPAPDEIRAIVQAVVETEYCGSAMMDGVNHTAALGGTSPVPGRGFVRLEEAQWRPVVLVMAREEFAQRQEEWAELLENVRRTSDALSACRTSRASRAERDTALDVYNRASRALNHPLAKFNRMLVLLGSTGETDEALDAFLERVVKECPPECDTLDTGILVWVRRTLREQRSERCFELGRWIREKWGFESAQHGRFCRTLFASMSELPRSDSERGKIARYLLDAVEHYERYESCWGFDMDAASNLPGWKGSLQRKRLAERFRDEPARGGTSHWDEETREYVRDSPRQRDVDLMLWSRAAAELATEDAELTDLREVYGDWTKERDDE